MMYMTKSNFYSLLSKVSGSHRNKNDSMGVGVGIVMAFIVMMLLVLISIAISPSLAHAADEDGIVGVTPIKRLFFDTQQRRIMESVRQGVVPEESQIITPVQDVVIEDEQLLSNNNNDRSRRSLGFDGLIRNRSTGKSSIWFSGAKDAVELPDNNSTYVTSDDSLAVGAQDGNQIVGVDAFNEANFRLKVGQSIDASGNIEEQYPVIIRRTSDR